MPLHSHTKMTAPAVSDGAEEYSIFPDSLVLDVDRLGPVRSAGDPDRPGLGVLPLGELDLQQAVLERGLDLLAVHVVGEREAAHELAVRALHAVIALALFLVLELARAAQGQHAVLSLDLDFVLLEAGKL